MEKLFRPSKWLVLFCAAFLLLYGALQYVATSRIQAEAEQLATNIFTWRWPGDNWQSQAKITEASVISRSANDAVVQVKGKQILTYFDPGDNPQHGKAESVDLTATLTMYRRSVGGADRWMLGKVELP